MKKFLNSKHEEVFHPIFLAQMVLSPLNSIVDDFLIKQYEAETEVQFTKQLNKKRKLHVLFRFDILCRMLDILGEFGTKPIFEKQKYVSKLINSKDFGLNATGSRVDSPAFVTGFTSAFFLTLPELFKMWVQQKDGDSENVNNYQILEFVGQQCLWPTFMNPKRMKTDKSGQAKQGLGTMMSNAKSKKPCSFLPEVFDLKELFKQCLDGVVEWRTPSLCEEPQIIQSPKDSATTEKTPEDEVEEEDATQDTSVENAAQESDKDKVEEDAQEEEESGDEDSQEKEADNDDEEDDEQEKKPKAKKRKMSNQAKAKKKKKSEQEVQDVDCSLNHLLEDPHNGTDISVDITNLLDYLDANASQNEYFAGLVQNVERWNKSGEIFAFPRNWDAEEE